MTDWRTYLAGFHARHAGITEDVLGRTLSDGLSPYDWLARAIPSDVGRVLDLACGSGPMTRVLSDAVPGRRTQVTGLDLSMAELARARERTRPDDDTSLVCGEAAGLPFADGCFDAVTSSMAMMVFDRYQPVLAECRRVLRPGGVLAMTVATAVPLRPSDVRFLTRLTARLRAVPQFPGGAELAGLANALDAIGFRMLEDARERFGFVVRDRADADLLLRAVYLPGTSDRRRASAARWLADRAAEQGDGVDIAIPIRRVVAARR